jgi:hypothetical protein
VDARAKRAKDSLVHIQPVLLREVRDCREAHLSLVCPKTCPSSSGKDGGSGNPVADARTGKRRVALAFRSHEESLF